MHPYVHCSITCIGQDMEATQVPINRQLGKEDVILLGRNKEYVTIYAKRMELEDIMLSEISQTEKDK